MATAGLSFTNPLLGKMNVGETPNPYAPFTPTADIGLGNLAPSVADMVALGEALAPQSQFTIPEMRKPPAIAFSPSRNELFVQGSTFSADDASAALNAEKLLSTPGTGLPTDGDWVPLDVGAYQQYLESIRNPSFGRLAAKNFGRGVDSLQALAGRGLQLLGAEELGQRIVDQQEEDLARTAPYERWATDIGSGNDAVEWFVANFAQQGPNMIESIITAGLGFMAGTALTGNPMAGVGGALAGLMGKKAFKNAVIAAARKKAAGKTLNAAEHKLLREAAGITGAVTAAYTSNAAIGAADVYNELREQGANADDIDARLKALALSAPYAALDTLPEFLFASRVFGSAFAPKSLPANASVKRKGLELLRRGGVGLGAGGLAEGVPELGQEAILLGASGQDFSSPENIDRLINAFAAGFGVGGPIGAVANLRSKEPQNLLNPAQSVEPQLPEPPAPPQLSGPPALPQPSSPGASAVRPPVFVTPEGVAYSNQAVPVQGDIPPGVLGPQGVLNIFGNNEQVLAQELAARMRPPAPLEQEQAQVPAQMPFSSLRQGELPLEFDRPQIMVTPEGLAYPDQTIQLQGNISPNVPGMQGVLNVFGGQIPAQELAARMRPNVVPEQAQLLPQAPAPLPRQGVLQFPEFEQQSPTVTQTTQETDTPLPMREAGRVAPKQLRLFSAKQAPRPNRAELLKRGAQQQALLDELAVTNTPSEPQDSPAKPSRQLSLFDKQGEPTLAALRAAGKKQKLSLVEQKTPLVTPSRMRGLKKQAGVAAIETVPEEVPNAVQKQSATQVPARKISETRGGVGAEVPAKEKPAGEGELAKTKAEALKKPAQKAEELKRGRSKKAASLWEEFADTDTQPTWEELTPEQKEEWAKTAVDKEKPTIADAERVAPPVTTEETGEIFVERSDQTDAELLDDAITTARSARTSSEFEDTIRTIVEYAFFVGESTNVKKLAEKARAYLAGTEFSDSQIATIDKVFVTAANYELQLEAVYKGGKNKSQWKPWFTYAESHGLLDSIKTPITNLPEGFKKPGNKTTIKPVATSAKRATESPEVLLGRLIDDLITRIREYSRLNEAVSFHGKFYSNLEALAKKLYAQVSEQGRNYIVRGHKLQEYFKADGSPKLIKSNGRLIITTKELTVKEQRELEQEQRKAAKELVAAEALRRRLEKEGYSEESAWDDTDGFFYRLDGEEIKGTLPAGRVRLLVKSFLSKLRVKPNTFVYANVADLKRRNPDLYRRAAAARMNGDFGAVRAVGYSFGSNVIIFSDFVHTERQLRFVLAHEALGHFGLKSVVPEVELAAILNRIYDSDPDVRAAVDAMVANRGMPKLEAVEEYVADNAADLDTSIIARVWNTIKNFLNKLGFEFQDDEARYVINLARRYIRQGDTGRFVNAHAIVGQFEAIGQARSEGRYARVHAGDMGSRLIAAGALNRRFGGTGGLRGAIDAFAKGVFGARKSVPGTVARILEQVQTLDNKARRSYGLSQIYRLLEKQHRFARSLLSKYQRMTAYTHSVDLGVLKKGVTEAEKERAGELLARAALLRASQLTDKKLASYDPLVVVDSMGNVAIDPAVYVKLEKDGFVTAEDFRNGFDITYSDGSKVHFQYDVDENSPEWKVYLELRTTVNETAIDLLLSNYQAAQSEATRVLNDLNLKRRGTDVFSEDDLAAIRRAAVIYNAKRYADSSVTDAGVETKSKSAKGAEDFVAAFGQALIDDDVYAAWVNAPNADAQIVAALQEYLDSKYDDIRAQLPSIKAKITDKKDSYKIQKAIRDLFLFDLQSKNADFFAKRTILGSYVPFTRRGTEQVMLVAVDAYGDRVPLAENIRSALPYFQFNTRHEALAAAEELDKVFGGGNEFVLLDEDENEIKVRLKAEVSRVRQSPDLTSSMNFNEFAYMLNRLNVNLAPQIREQIITTLTQQNARARHNLQRSGTEGWDKDVVRAVSEHLETTAHVAARKIFRHRLDDILLNKANWLGDNEKLRALKVAVDMATTEGERARAQRAYDEYAYMYRYMKATAGENTVVIDGKRVPTLGRGEDYREEAKRVLRWYNETTNIADSTEDFLSGEAGSTLKLATVLMQLGGSVATAAVNLTSLATHSFFYLSYYNPARAFGGGYGEVKSATALWKAAKDVKNFRLEDPAFLENLLRTGEYTRYGLTEDEAVFLFEQTEEGTLQAAQFNALIGTARGKVFNNKAQAAIKAWMSMFTYTEQFNRRVTALATYRLEKERLRAQGVTDEGDIVYTAAEAARTAVNTSQGEYAMFNRPEMARGSVLQYIFVYKQFVIITVQLLRSLPAKERMLALGLLALFSGLRGIPFAEDVFDVVDTIAQKLGLKMASVEKEIAEWIDAVAPGVTPYVMRGVLDRMTGATISTRLGMGDLLPLTGAFKAGADPAREAANFAGPVFSGIAGLVGMAGNLTRYGAEAIGLRDDTTSLSSILRNSPITAVRAVADGMIYFDDGMITNNRGQVISREAPYYAILARMLGFYPAVATEQNDIVRLSKSVASYAKAVKAEYVSAYVKAKLEGDTKRMQKIVSDVRQWNEDAKGTGLEISSFVRSANRAALEASQPTVQRYLKSVAKQVRPETMKLLEINGLGDEI